MTGYHLYTFIYKNVLQNEALILTWQHALRSFHQALVHKRNCRQRKKLLAPAFCKAAGSCHLDSG
jgi:hypothetical protein